MPKRLSCKAEVATNYSCWGEPRRSASALASMQMPHHRPLLWGGGCSAARRRLGPTGSGAEATDGPGAARPRRGRPGSESRGAGTPQGPARAGPPRRGERRRLGPVAPRERERVAFSLSNVFSPSSSRCRAEDSRFLAHRGAVKPGRYKVVVEMNTYRRSPWDGDPVQALKNNDSKTKKKSRQ